MIDEEGVVQEDVQYTTPDGQVNLYVGDGTTALTEGGEPLQFIEVQKVCEGLPPPPPGAIRLGCAYDFGPDGATFDPPITITLSYNPASIPEGVAEEDLFVAFYDVSTGQWVVLPSTVDTENNTITVKVSGFTKFAVYSPALTPTPTPTETPTPTPPAEDEANNWLIIGPIIAVILIGIVVYWWLRRRGKSEESEGSESQAE